MMKLATASMFVLFWVFYEVSGGASFTPRERVIVSQAPWVVREESRQLVAQQPVTQSAAAAEVVATPLAPTTQTAPVQVALRTDETPQPTPAVQTALTDTTPVVPVQVAEATPAMIPLTTRAKAPRVVLPQPDPTVFLRVTGSRVNMRAGPNTGHAVLDTLTQGTRVEKVSLSQSGWMEIRVPGSNATGWMSADFLQAE